MRLGLHHLHGTFSSTASSSTVFILGAHPLNGFSMRRYTTLLEQAYKDMGWDVRTLRPTGVLSSALPPGSIRKLAIYLEKLLLFPLTLWRVPRGSQVHIADHSDAIWLLHHKLRDSKSVVTCHDLFAIQAARGTLPEYYPRWPGRFYQYLIEKGLKNSQRIIAVSHCTAQTVKAHLPTILCQVVNNPLDPAFALGIPAPEQGYALIVGANDWRKRRRLAISAWIHAESQRMQPRRLILVGPEITPDELQLLATCGFNADLISSQSRVSESALIKLYAEAAYLILASKYEGFAWPIIEANALGVPVLCADEPILRETGFGNVFFNTDLRANDWPQLLSAAMNLRHSGFLVERAKSFSHPKFVAELEKSIDRHGTRR